jgi:dihydrodiol dehydrogenase / D-xylose 1-dehydrogenase (NADP)
MNEGQVKRLCAHAKEKKLFLMEAVWSRFFPIYKELKKGIDDGALGEIQEVDVEFGFKLTHVERVRTKNLGGGTILDLGIYTIQLSLWAFGGYPVEIKADGALNEEGVDIDVKGELKFANGGVAKIRTSGTEELRNSAIIRGTKGTVELYTFWCPTEFKDTNGEIKEYPLPEAKLDFMFTNSCGLRFEAEETRQRILAGDLESSTVSHEDSMKIARIEDELRRQLGVVLPED